MSVEREVSRKDERRIEMALKIARFPMVRETRRLRLQGTAERRPASGAGAGDVAVGGALRHTPSARPAGGRRIWEIYT